MTAQASSGTKPSRRTPRDLGKPRIRPAPAHPWPTVFGHHEFFHAATPIGAACQQVSIYLALFAH